MKKIIDISVVIGSDIRTRSRIRLLTELISQEDCYDIDFSNVLFISRSFADEFITFIDNSAGRIQCVNVPNDIEQLLTIVRRNRNTHSASSCIRGNVIKLETDEQMAEFFNAF